MKSSLELWRLKELYKTFRGKHRGNKETRKALRGGLFRRKIVFVFCLLIFDQKAYILTDSLD